MNSRLLSSKAEKAKTRGGEVQDVPRKIKTFGMQLMKNFTHRIMRQRINAILSLFEARLTSLIDKFLQKKLYREIDHA
jgi:hypothetical protein